MLLVRYIPRVSLVLLVRYIPRVSPVLLVRFIPRVSPVLLVRYIPRVSPVLLVRYIPRVSPVLLVRYIPRVSPVLPPRPGNEARAAGRRELHEGEFLHDACEGQGTRFYPTGETYVGGWHRSPSATRPTASPPPAGRPRRACAPWLRRAQAGVGRCGLV